MNKLDEKETRESMEVKLKLNGDDMFQMYIVNLL